MRTLSFVLAFSACLSCFAQSKLNPYLVLNSGDTIRGNKLQFIVPSVKDRSYFVSDLDTFSWKKVSSFQNQSGNYINLLNLSKREMFGQRFIKGKVDVYEAVLTKFTLNSKWGVYYKKFEEPLKPLKFKNLYSDLGDNPKAIYHLRKRKAARTVGVILTGIGVATTISGAVLDEPGLFIGGGFFMLAGGIPFAMGEKRLIKAIEAYNE